MLTFSPSPPSPSISDSGHSDLFPPCQYSLASRQCLFYVPNQIFCHIRFVFHSQYNETYIAFRIFSPYHKILSKANHTNIYISTRSFYIMCHFQYFVVLEKSLQTNKSSTANINMPSPIGTIQYILHFMSTKCSLSFPSFHSLHTVTVTNNIFQCKQCNSTS